jgi:predicted nucleic acid-binding protein
VFVDTDFLLALLKPKDWLKPEAERLLAEHRPSLRSTEANLLELLLVAHGVGFDPLELVLRAHEVAPFVDQDVAVRAAANVLEFGMTPFDATLAAHAEVTGEPIISSDRSMDRTGARRVALR